MVLDVNMVPEAIFSHIKTEKVRFHEENGNIVLSPIKNNPNVNELFGMFSDGKLSIDGYLKEKQLEKELEN